MMPMFLQRSNGTCLGIFLKFFRFSKSGDVLPGSWLLLPLLAFGSWPLAETAIAVHTKPKATS
jgi:hypothetical protein